MLHDEFCTSIAVYTHNFLVCVTLDLPKCSTNVISHFTHATFSIDFLCFFPHQFCAYIFCLRLFIHLILTSVQSEHIQRYYLGLKFAKSDNFVNSYIQLVNKVFIELGLFYRVLSRQVRGIMVMVGQATDGTDWDKGKYALIRDVEDFQSGIYDKPLPCFGCGIGWFS